MNLDRLKEILNPSIVVDAFDTNVPNAPTINLKEENINKLGKIKLHLPSNENLILKLDKELRFRPRCPATANKSNYLNSEKSRIHCGCDYVVITKYREKIWVNFIELKSDSTSGAHAQLYYSIPHIEYYLSLLRYHDKCEFNIEYKFLLFSTKMGSIKTLTKPGQIEKVDLMDTGYKCYLPGARTEFYLSNILA